MWGAVLDSTPVLANLATIVGLIFVVLQLRTAAQNSRIQAWAFLLDTSNRRWSHYIAAKDPDEKRFALGELLNFMEVIAGDIVEHRLPHTIAEQITPYFLGNIGLLAREPSLRAEVKSMVLKARTFSELRALALRHRTEFGAVYADVEAMLDPPQ